MKEKDTEFKVLKRMYPKTMSKDQFYQVAHISKATALYLLQYGLVPCIDSGKKTRRYLIKTDDVIAYLKDREINPAAYKPVPGWYRGTAGKKRPADETKPLILTSEQQHLLILYLTRLMLSYDDLLTVKELSKFLGYDTTSIINWCHFKNLKHFNISGRFLIPKISAIEFLASPRSCTACHKSKRHKELLSDFVTVNRIRV